MRVHTGLDEYARTYEAHSRPIVQINACLFNIESNKTGRDTQGEVTERISQYEQNPRRSNGMRVRAKRARAQVC
eukprot:6203892-Pleurochrysis_carterae.AAC.4